MQRLFRIPRFAFPVTLTTVAVAGCAHEFPVSAASPSADGAPAAQAPRSAAAPAFAVYRLVLEDGASSEVDWKDPFIRRRRDLEIYPYPLDDARSWYVAVDARRGETVAQLLSRRAAELPALRDHQRWLCRIHEVGPHPSYDCFPAEAQTLLRANAIASCTVSDGESLIFADGGFTQSQSVLQFHVYWNARGTRALKALPPTTAIVIAFGDEVSIIENNPEIANPGTSSPTGNATDDEERIRAWRAACEASVNAERHAR